MWSGLEVVAAFLAHGLPPVAGGLLDQTPAFLEAVRLVAGQRAAWRAKLGGPAE